MRRHIDKRGFYLNLVYFKSSNLVQQVQSILTSFEDFLSQARSSSYFRDVLEAKINIHVNVSQLVEIKTNKMNQNQLLNRNKRSQQGITPATLTDFGSQVLDPEILGIGHKKSKAGNSHVNVNKQATIESKPKESKGDGDTKTKVARSKKSWEKYFEELGEFDIDLSSFPSITYTFMTPPDSTMDSSVYVRPKGHNSQKSRQFLNIGDDCEGRFEYGESSECWERQADASTNTKPIGYRALHLNPKSDSIDSQTQVEPKELDRATATLRGIILNPNNILWSANGEFTILKAEKQIEEFIGRCWNMCSKWYYHIQFLHSTEECYRNRYFFEVKCSLPTKEDPIPIATASVYFAFEVEIYSGRDEPVKVYYVLEGTRFPHTPGDIPFKQKWLSGIICEKMRLFRSKNFKSALLPCDERSVI